MSKWLNYFGNYFLKQAHANVTEISWCFVFTNRFTYRLALDNLHVLHVVTRHVAGTQTVVCVGRLLERILPAATVYRCITQYGWCASYTVPYGVYRTQRTIWCVSYTAYQMVCIVHRTIWCVSYTVPYGVYRGKQMHRCIVLAILGPTTAFEITLYINAIFVKDM